ncbi:zeta toxin family protein [Salicibibacter cibi]|uniref:UDP-N-acetylglucosamine kinase n=1 Tax=Salicibibacter cibi TaxID=2743001 RepID=A0A7T6Z9X9_9BACI|nr:zeta toxin family protein [Salicibibacter cibi]QQK79628.1 zeta toxin family protein [Salicibibacter cibi]
MKENQPVMYIFAGNNGSGKSTVRAMFYDFIGAAINIDPDALMRRHMDKGSEQPEVSAGREALRLANECINTGTDFSVETTLAGQTTINQIKKARRKGFFIQMIFVGTYDVNINIMRIAKRVENGGHDIPTNDVIRRSDKCLFNLNRNYTNIDSLILVDNSTLEASVIAVLDKDRIEEKYHPLPDWCESIITQYKYNLKL